MPTNRRRAAWTVALLLAAAALCPPRRATAAASIDERLEKASACAEQRDRYDEGLRIAEGIVSDPQAATKQRLAAFDIVVTILRRQRKRTEIVEASQRLARAFPHDAKLLSRAALAEADTLWEQRKGRDEVVAKLEEVLRKLQGDKEAAAAVHARLGRMLREMGKHDRAYEQSQAALETGVLSDKQAAEVLRDMADAAWSAGDMARCEAALKRLLEPRHLEAIQSWERSGVRDRYAEALIRQKKYDQARRLYEELARQEKDLRRAQRYALLIGDVYRSAQRYDEALKAYERVFLDYGEINDCSCDAQAQIAETLKAKGDYAGALKAARIPLDAAWDSNRLTSAAQVVAELLKAADKHVGRANAFILFQKHGPAGEDGRPGTGDDLTDPLAEVGYPSYPQREKAFAQARARAGDDADASRFRALTWLYTGRPREALRMYLDAFARSDMGSLSRIGRDLVVVGVRAVQGHPHGLERFFAFLNYGPAGPDGKLKTADDLANPFLELGLEPADFAPRAPDKAEWLAAADVRALREARSLLREVAAGRLEDAQPRRDALAALVRVQLALNEWQDGPRWYLDQLGANGRDRGGAAAWVEAGQLAAKAGACHLGAVHAFWRTYDGLDLFEGSQEPREISRVRSAFERASGELRKPRPLVPRSLKTWRVEPYRMAPPRLKPYAEDGAKR
jgi:tetratricopeptide (TPR) repeat protein